VAFGGTGLADVNRWESRGPFSMYPSIVDIDPHDGSVFAVTTAGLARSSDKGASWNIQSRFEGEIHDLEFDLSTPGTIFASQYVSQGGDRSSLLRSNDGGVNWVDVSPDVNAADFLAGGEIVIDPHASSTLYVTGGHILAGGSQKLFKTTDGGATWRALVPPNGFAISSLVADPGSSNVLYAIGREQPQLETVYKTTDGAETWVVAHQGLTSSLSGVTLVGTSPPSLLAWNPDGAIFRSVDAAQSWTPVSGPGASVQNLISDSRSSVVYANGTHGDLHRSDDGGVHWTSLNEGVTALAVSSSSVWGHAWIGDLGAILESEDGGMHWNDRTGAFSDVAVESLTALPGTPRVFATSSTYPFLEQTFDGGSNWSTIRISVRSLAFDPSNTSRLFSSGPLGNWRSYDSGSSWFLLPDPPNPGVVAIDSRSTVFIGFDGGNPISRSDDFGEHWMPGGTGLPDSLSTKIEALLVDPQRLSGLYAAFRSEGVFKTIDSGASWTPTNAGLPVGAEFRDLALDPNASASLFVAVAGHGIYRSNDGGASWGSANGGLTGEVLSLAVDPFRPGAVYAGTDGQGVFRSLDRGSSWEPFNDNLENLVVKAIAIAGTAQAPVIHAGTSQGLFRASLEPANFDYPRDPIVPRKGGRRTRVLGRPQQSP
jgi:photosystem II stability/assembly factor-like uncharacterized protein